MYVHHCFKCIVTIITHHNQTPIHLVARHQKLWLGEFMLNDLFKKLGVVYEIHFKFHLTYTSTESFFSIQVATNILFFIIFISSS